MDDLLVIILTLTFAVIGALGQIKKKKQAAPKVEPHSESDDYWEMMEEAEDEFEPKPKEMKASQSFAPKTETIAEDRSISYYIKQNKKSIFEENIKKGNKKQKSIISKENNFSLRKAVIYNEILNRKYS